MFYKHTRQELKSLKASDFKEGDVILCGKYYIHIEYGNYDKPGLKSFISNANTHKIIGCTPGADRPYYLDNFLHR